MAEPNDKLGANLDPATSAMFENMMDLDDLLGAPHDPAVGSADPASDANWPPIKDDDFVTPPSQPFWHSPTAPASLIQPASDTAAYTLTVERFPVKSRVETQVKCKLIISPPPPCRTLHIPTETIARPRLQLSTPFKPHPDTLMLDANVAVEGRSTKPVFMCVRCLNREQRRAARKKSIDTSEQSHWDDSQLRSPLVFNCNEVMDLSPPVEIDGRLCRTVSLPMRIACYCRHHDASQGFRVNFRLMDYRGLQLASTASSPILITDDHKGAPPPSLAPQYASAAAGPALLPAKGGTSTPTMFSAQSLSSASSPSDFSSNSYLRQARNLQAIPPMPSSIAPRLSSQPNTAPAPVINRIIPPEGTVMGGIDVTILGSGFVRGLTVMFGGTVSTFTEFWNENTIIARVPPAQSPGAVYVSFTASKETSLDPNATFTYIDDTDSKLLETAVNILLSRAGEVPSTIDIRSLFAGSSRSNGNTDNSFVDPQNTTLGADLNGFVLPDTPVSNSSHATPTSDAGTASDAKDVHEAAVIKCIEKAAASGVPNWQWRNTEGQALIHLAAARGYAKTVKLLLLSGARLDTQDINGFTPLHFAALRGHRSVVEILLHQKPSKINLKSVGGDRAVDIAHSSVIELFERRSSPGSTFSSYENISVLSPPRDTHVTAGKLREMRSYTGDKIELMSSDTEHEFDSAPESSDSIETNPVQAASLPDHFARDPQAKNKPPVPQGDSRCYSAEMNDTKTDLKTKESNQPPRYEEIYPTFESYEHLIAELWKENRKKLSDDPLLFLFWLPALLLVIVLVFYVDLEETKVLAGEYVKEWLKMVAQWSGGFGDKKIDWKSTRVVQNSQISAQ